MTNFKNKMLKMKLIKIKLKFNIINNQINVIYILTYI
jgi:hypothetical protein